VPQWQDHDVASNPDQQLRLMAVHAHPDDESSKGAATMAKLLAEGVEVTVVTCTGGERGEVLNPALDRPEVWKNITKVRHAEMELAREIIGFRQEWLGFVDSGPFADMLPADSFAAKPVLEAAKPLVRLVRELKPHVILTYDEEGGYPHPDHIMCHKVSVVAFEAAGDRTRYVGEGEPWQPSKLYYHMARTRKWLHTIHEALLAASLKSPYHEWFARDDKAIDKFNRVTTRVECGEYFGVRDAALRAHATQIDPAGIGFAATVELQRKLWPTEDYELARSLVNTQIPEDDLFAGVAQGVLA